MNIGLDEVVVMNVSDEALQLAAGGTQENASTSVSTAVCGWCKSLLSSNPRPLGRGY